MSIIMEAVGFIIFPYEMVLALFRFYYTHILNQTVGSERTNCRINDGAHALRGGVTDSFANKQQWEKHEALA